MNPQKLSDPIEEDALTQQYLLQIRVFELMTSHPLQRQINANFNVIIKNFQEFSLNLKKRLLLVPKIITQVHLVFHFYLDKILEPFVRFIGHSNYKLNSSEDEKMVLKIIIYVC